MNDFVYILIEDDTDIHNNTNVFVFYDLDTANAELLKLKNDFEKDNNMSDFIVEDDTSTEEDTMFNYCAYEKGNYNNNHYCLTIYQREII